MDRRARTAPRTEVRLHRFLRPGALARLRDSRIVARSLRSAGAVGCLLPPSIPPLPTPPSVAAAAEQQGGMPHFLAPTRGLGGAARYPLRRRMVAPRGVVFLPPPAAAATEAFLDVL